MLLGANADQFCGLDAALSSGDYIAFGYTQRSGQIVAQAGQHSIEALVAIISLCFDAMMPICTSRDYGKPIISVASEGCITNSRF